MPMKNALRFFLHPSEVIDIFFYVAFMFSAGFHKVRSGRHGALSTGKPRPRRFLPNHDCGISGTKL